jgi:hypothetical protein
MVVQAVAFSPTPGTYSIPKTVTLTTTPGATIYYTVDGSTPSASSPAYTGPLTVATSTTIKAIGVRSNWTSSAVATATYTMNFGTLAAPTFSPAPGTYQNDVTLTLAAAAGATIRYETAPTAVGPSSPVYTAPLSVSSARTIHARAYQPDSRPVDNRAAPTHLRWPRSRCRRRAVPTRPVRSSR